MGFSASPRHPPLLWSPSPSRTIHRPGPSLRHQALRPRGQILRRVSARPKLAVGRAEEGEPGVAERSWLHEDGEERRARYKANRVSLHLLQLVLLGHAVSEPSPREVPFWRGIDAKKERRRASQEAPFLLSQPSRAHWKGCVSSPYLNASLRKRRCSTGRDKFQPCVGLISQVYNIQEVLALLQFLPSTPNEYLGL